MTTPSGTSALPTHPLQRARTKIVATVGPACRDPERLQQLVLAGVNVFRLNMAHGTLADHETTLGNIRQISEQLQMPLAVLVDLSGPKIRLGQLALDPVVCQEGQRMFIRRGIIATAPDELVCSYQPLIDELEVGNQVRLADGIVTLSVVRKEADVVECLVVAGGEVRSRQGVNLPGVKLSVAAMTPDDLVHAEWAARMGADFVSLSFVRRADDVRQLKQLLAEHQSTAMVIAKIEKPEALAHLSEIVQEADGIMVARGDLGVEIDVATMPFAQKRIIEKCSQFKKPVIVATQMLDSMQNSRQPTRAEVTDVANAILDGADACMLSGETAIGKFPREAVATMNRIMQASEELMKDRLLKLSGPQPTPGVHPITAAVVEAAARIARDVEARVFVIATRTGNTALAKAKLREMTPTLAISENPAVMRQMCLFWGIHPMSGASAQSGPELRDFINRWGQETGALRPGDRVVYVAGSGILKGAHNQLVVHEIEIPPSTDT